MGPREYFGEMSLFDGETRSATVTATTRVRLLRLERQALFQVIDDHPGIAIALCQTMTPATVGFSSVWTTTPTLGRVNKPTRWR